MHARSASRTIALISLAFAGGVSAYSAWIAGGNAVALIITLVFIALTPLVIDRVTSDNIGHRLFQRSSSGEHLFKNAAFEGSSVAMMMVDRDFNITHVNQATLRLLEANETGFRQIVPSFEAHAIVGSNIDIFHKNPAHQRGILSDPARLPYQTDITVGDLKFALNVSGVFNKDGEYVGNVMEWDDVTEARLNSGALAALDRSMATIEFQLDGTITHANHKFLKTVGYGLEEIVGHHHDLLVDPDEAHSEANRHFWETLSRGRIHEGKFRRLGKDGREIWIHGTYFPINDGNGKTFKVLQFAADITQSEHSRLQRDQERKQHAEELALVIDTLALGLKRISAGDFNAQIETEFAQDYRQIRDDFNMAVTQLQTAETHRLDAEKAQSFVVENLAKGLDNLSHGDLVQTIDAVFASEYESLRADFNQALNKLRHTMSQITETAEGIRHGSAEITESADELSGSTEHQAATLNATATALTQITSAVKQTSESADEANWAASATRSEAQTGGEIVLQAVNAMGEIETSSGQISQIISVIDDIAFQTNLLALNAGVEAARAGEAGRGFAVVANEVRALAQRSSSAAKEIKELISSSSEHVDVGVNLVGRAGEALQQILNRVENVSHLVSEIAESARKQSACLSELNLSVIKMDQVTQQNAAMVEQTTAASHALTDDANALMEQVSHFTIDAAQHTQMKVCAHKGSPIGVSDPLASQAPNSVADQRNRALRYAHMAQERAESK